jgi:predicted nucleic acid-binding protein
MVVADTSGLISLIVDTDSNHERALALSQIFDASEGGLIIPSDVFTETMNVLGRQLGHLVATESGRRILASPSYLIARSDESHEAAMEQFAKQPGSVSFTDCIVMAMADRFDTTVVFAFDAVFRKNGYRLPEVEEDEKAA